MVGDDHASEQTAEGRDAISLADAEDRRVDMGCASLEGLVRICDGAARVVVEMRLDVTRDDVSQGADELVDLARSRTAYRVGNTNAVDADPVDCLVERQQVNKVGPERVLAGDCDGC